MLIHESHVFQLQRETKFEVCDPQSVFFLNATGLCYKEERPEIFRPYSLLYK